MKRHGFEYSGIENLEAMTQAVNYNDYLIKTVLNQVRVRGKNIKILDFGAGSGTYADLMMEEGIKVECLEPDKKLQSKLIGKGYKVYGSINEVKGKFDLIYALNVFEHIENDQKTISILSRNLKSSGSLVIYVPAFQLLYSSMDKLVGHFRRYSLKTLIKLANSSNLKVVQSKYCDPIGFLVALIFKVAGNKRGVISPFSVRLYDRIVFPISRLIEPLFSKIGGKNALVVVKK